MKTEFCFWAPVLVLSVTSFLIIFNILQKLEVFGDVYARIIVVLLFQLCLLKIIYLLYAKE